MKRSVLNQYTRPSWLEYRLAADSMCASDGILHTLSVDSPMLISVSMRCLICAGIQCSDSEFLVRDLGLSLEVLPSHCLRSNSSDYSMLNVMSNAKSAAVQAERFCTAPLS